MKDTIYYFHTISGATHFSTGITKSMERTPQYLRMLRYAKYPTMQLHLDNPEDFIVICNLFNIHGHSWQEIYNESI